MRDEIHEHSRGDEGAEFLGTQVVQREKSLN